MKIVGCMMGSGVYQDYRCPVAPFCPNYDKEYYYKLNSVYDLRTNNKLSEAEAVLDYIDEAVKKCPLLKTLVGSLIK